MKSVNIHGGSVDLERGIVRGTRATEPLTNQECALLAYLAERPRAVVPRDELLREVWGYSPRAVTRAVDVAVRRLRQKIEPDPSEPVHVLTERGVGYRFEPAIASTEGPSTSFTWSSEPLVGRQSELAALRQLASTERRLTVTGPPGIGKTRLVAELAREGVFVVCAGLEPDEVLTALANSLNIESDSPFEAIGEALSSRPDTRVVLDGVERVVESLRGWLESWSSEVCWVFTSRLALGVDGERILRLSGLAEADAVELLTRRARAVAPSWSGTDEQLAAVVAQVDGNPLAVELAAGRAAVLGPADLAAALDKPLQVLGGNQPGEALRDAVAWSWSMLSTDDARALVQCAVFRGPFDVDDADAVVELGTDGPWVVDWLQSLASQSMLRIHQRDGHRRYSVSRTVRAFAAERDGELWREARERLGRRIVSKGLQWVERLDGPERAAVRAQLQRLSPDLEALARRESASPASRADAVWCLHHSTVTLRDRLDLAEAIPMPDGASGTRLRVVLSETYALKNDTRRAAEHAEAAGDSRGRLVLAELELDGALGIADIEAVRSIAESYWARGRHYLGARALRLVGIASMVGGDLDGAEAVYQQIVDRGEMAQDQRVEALGWSLLGFVAWNRRRLHDAVDCYQQALEFARAGDLRRAEALALGHLGSLEVWLGNIDGAVLYLEEALRLHRESGEVRYQVYVEANLGRLALYGGRVPEGIEHLQNSCRLSLSQGGPDDFLTIREAHLGIGYLLADQRSKSVRALGRALERAESIEHAYLVGFVQCVRRLAGRDVPDEAVDRARGFDTVMDAFADFSAGRPGASEAALAVDPTQTEGLHPLVALAPHELHALVRALR